MNPPKRLTTQHKQEEQQETTARQDQQTQPGQEFNTVDEMLRHDALHTPVPPEVARRLEKSLQEEAPASSPWWKRWMGGAK